MNNGDACIAMLRALIIGVADYSATSMSNLVFCTNDIYAIKAAFIEGLKVDPKNISICGASGSVFEADFLAEMYKLSTAANKDDTLLVYFSGHGGSSSGEHYLCLSDSTIKTHVIIDCLEKIPAKNKVLFLDCCEAGNFSIDNSAVFDIDDTANKFAGKGYAVIASSNATQNSYGHPDKPISLFTSFLCDVLCCTRLIREGKKSLYDINKLLTLYMEMWSKNHPSRMQKTIFRANIGGTIFFKVQDFAPYQVDCFYKETKDFVIYEVEPTHHGTAKRFVVKVILKEPFSFYEISSINNEIVEIVKPLDIFGNTIQQQQWKKKDANIVFCYYGLDEQDIIDCNYICHTTWVDDKQDKDNWYRAGKNRELINNVFFNFHPYYQTLKVFNEEHTDSEENLIKQTRVIMSCMITLAEKAIFVYNEFLNNVIKENDFVNDMVNIAPKIQELYSKEGNLGIPPNELKEWGECCAGLSASIHDFVLFYNPKSLSERSPENRKACMDLAIKQYYKDLEKLKHIEVELFND